MRGFGQRRPVLLAGAIRDGLFEEAADEVGRGQGSAFGLRRSEREAHVLQPEPQLEGGRLVAVLGDLGAVALVARLANSVFVTMSRKSALDTP